MNIYISGKISGLSQHEYSRLFALAEKQIYWLKEFDGKRDLIKFINPLKIKPLFGINKWLLFMVADIWQQRKCVVSAFQPNWIDSRGAVIEYFFAKWIFKQKIIFL